ncbi:MAG: hypothetical protein NT004_14165 [Bacteroidetes bacterium]|nr:hypothetical protein [Bacteroidota bacterium]
MKKLIWTAFLITFFTLFTNSSTYSIGPLDPVRLNSMTLNVGVGAGALYFGNGVGFGPAMKVSFEAGMWDLGPGVITLGGETTFSIFNNRYGNDWRESWFNLMIGARGAYHYGWNVEGLDTYAGFPAGMGFCIHSFDDEIGSQGFQAVYPYFGFFFGASYFFNKSIGINGEVGYNSTHANIGVVFKLK